MKSERDVSQSYPILSDPVDRSLPGSSVHGIFQARVLEWGAIAFSVLEEYDLKIQRKVGCGCLNERACRPELIWLLANDSCVR